MPDVTTHSPSNLATPLAASQPPIGIDIGGTKINAAVVTPPMAGHDNQLTSLKNAPTPANDSKVFLETLVTMIRELHAEHQTCAVGIATAGVVDSARGKILGSTGNLPALQEIADLKKLLEDRVQLPVHIENDANAAAYGEFRAGAAKGAKNSFAITLGTGVGMGIIFEGKMVRGSHYFAAEGGHIALSTRQERKCTCGRWDCWEAFASGRGLEITADEVLKAATDAERQAFIDKYQQDSRVSTYSVIQAHQQKDPLGQVMLNDWHQHVAIGIGSMINVLDPDIVVVGGGLAQFVDFDLLRPLIGERVMGSGTQVLPATLGNYAGIVGAAYLALEAVQTGSPI